MIPRIRSIAAVAALVGLLAASCADDGAGTDEGSVRQVEIAANESLASVPDVEEESPESGDVRATVVGTSVVDITVVGVTGYEGGDLGGVVTREADGLVVGGFATKIVGDPFTTSQSVFVPQESDVVAGAWPHVTAERADVPPGEYVLSLWVDAGLGGYTRWFPLNSDGRGLAGCVQRFSVGDGAVTEVVVGGDVRSNGELGVCEPAVVGDDRGVASAPVEMVAPGRTRVTAPFSAEFDGDRFGMVQELVVWRGEFLAIGRIDAPQPLPLERPIEIAGQFPPEIQGLFPDGLPPTIEEAMAVIEEADMMTEVTDAVSSIPGAQEAIFALDPMPPTWLFARSVDGSDWEQVDVTLPAEIVQIFDVVASGDQLVVVGYRASPGVPVGSSEIAVAWSDDLVSWTTAGLGAERPDDLPEGATLEIWRASAHANDLGWMVDTSVSLNLGASEPPEHPSPELARYLEDGGWGPEPVSTLWFSSWDGEPAVTLPGASAESTVDENVVVATGTGFVLLSDAVLYTDDGETWVTRSGPATSGIDDPWRTTTQLIPDGFVVFEGSSARSTVHRVDDRGERWTQLEVPDLPAELWPVIGSNGYLFADNVWDAYFEQWIVATPDGEHWHIEQFDSFDPEADVDGSEPWVAALRDDTLLVGGAFARADWWKLEF